MSKKLVSLVLVLMLLMTGVVYAEFAGSKTTSDMVSAAIVSNNGVALSPNFKVIAEEESIFSSEVLEDIANYLSAGNSAVVGFFPAEAQDEISKQLPFGTNMANLVIGEFVALDVQNYLNVYGEVTVAFTFATAYVPGETVIAVVGIDVNDDVEWKVLPAEVNAEGDVEITFPEDILELVEANEAVLAILSDSTVIR